MTVLQWVQWLCLVCSPANRSLCVGAAGPVRSAGHAPQQGCQPKGCVPDHHTEITPRNQGQLLHPSYYSHAKLAWKSEVSRAAPEITGGGKNIHGHRLTDANGTSSPAPLLGQSRERAKRRHTGPTCRLSFNKPSAFNGTAPARWTGRFTSTSSYRCSSDVKVTDLASGNVITGATPGSNLALMSVTEFEIFVLNQLTFCLVTVTIVNVGWCRWGKKNEFSNVAWVDVEEPAGLTLT